MQADTATYGGPRVPYAKSENFKLTSSTKFFVSLQ
jgi:hypothetical protein